MSRTVELVTSNRGDARSFARRLRRVVLPLFTLLAIGYLGGPSLLLLTGSVLLTAAALQRSEAFRGGVGVLASAVAHAAWLMIYMGTLLPWVLRLPGLRSVVARPIEQIGFHAVTFPGDSVGLFWLGSLVALVAPGAVSAVVLIRGRASYRPFSGPLLGRLTWLAMLVPLVLVDALKWFQPWRAITFIMSGDARNHFLMVEEIRVTSSVELSPLSFSFPKLSNALGALLSSGNGTRDTLQSADLWAMLAVYTISVSVLVIATMTGFVAGVAKGGRPRWMALPVVGAAVLLATNSLLLATVLRDGFMSLYFGTALLGASLVLAVLLPVGGAKVALLIAGAVSLMGAYSALAPVLGVVLVVEIYRWIWQSCSARRRVVVLISWSSAVVLGGAIVARRSWTAFQETVTLTGSIAQVDAGALWVLLAFAVTFWFVGSAFSRAAGRTAAVAILASLLVVQLIERLPANAGAAYSYYSSKTIVGTAGAVLCLSLVPLGGVFTTMRRRSSGRLVTTAALTAASLVGYAIAEEASTMPRPWSQILDGWAYPDAASIEQAVGRWGDPPYLFFRFVDSPPLVAYPSPMSDRIVSFWSPATWGYVGPWSAVWNWAYTEMNSLDAGTLCSPISSGVMTIYTRDPGLPQEVAEACGVSNVKVVVFPRVTS